MSWHTALIGVLAMAPVSFSDPQVDDAEHPPIRGVYRIYGGSLADPSPPTGADKKVMFRVTGKTAKDLFAAIGPDKKDACSTEPGERIRKLDGEKLFCSRSAKGEYSCSYGFDLRTGKSIGGIVC